MRRLTRNAGKTEGDEMMSDDSARRRRYSARFCGCCRIAIRFLLVDRVIDIRGDEHGVGIKNVTMNEPHFVGHFPENPVMPGVLMIEGMAQTACVLVSADDAADREATR